MRTGRPAALAAVLLLVLAVEAWGQPSGEAYLTAALSRQSSPSGSGTLAGFTLGFGIGTPTLVFGPELIFQSGDSLRVRGFAVAVRLRQGGRWLHPHLVVGLGTYAWQRLTIPSVAEAELDPTPFWREVNYISGALGGGATIGPWRGRVTGVVEARWHRNLDQDSVEGSRSLVGLEAGLRLWW